MEPDGSGGYYCLQCMQDMINQMEDEEESKLAQQHPAETTPMEVDPSSLSDLNP